MDPVKVEEKPQAAAQATPPSQEPPKMEVKSVEQGQPPVVPPAPVAPEEIKVALPAGTEVDQEVLKEFIAQAKEIGLNSKQAQALVDFNFRQAAKTIKAQETAATEWRRKNEESLKADPEFGRDFEANKVVAQRPLAKYGDPKLAEKLAKSGWENDPDMVKFLHRVGKAMGEDSTNRPHPISQEATDEEQRLRQRYDKSPTLFPTQRNDQ